MLDIVSLHLSNIYWPNKKNGAQHLSQSRRFWLALLVSSVLLAIFVTRIDIRETAKIIGQANYLLIPISLIAYFIAVFFRSLRWKYLLFPIKNVPTIKLFPIVVIGYMANNVLPARLGEFVRAYYIGEKEQVSKLASLATIAIERVLDGITLLFFILAASLVLPVVQVLQGIGIKAGISWMILTMLLSLPFLIAALAMILAAFYPDKLQTFISKMTCFLPQNMRFKSVELVKLFIEGFMVLRDPSRLLSVFLLSLPVWISEAVMYYIVGLAFGLNDYFSATEFIGAILLVTAASNLATSLPAAGGGIGSFEVASSITLGLLGVDTDLSAAYTIVLHLSLLLPVTLLGMVYLWADKISVTQLVRYSKVK